MSRIVDNMIALRILKMLVTPFTDTEAYHLGIIDAHGKPIRKVAELHTSAEQEAYNYLTRLVFSMKRIINRLPGGESKIKSLVAALWLVKEYYETGNRSTSLMQEKFDNLVKMMDNHVVLCEEEIIVKKFLEEDGEGGAPTNNTSGPVATQEPKIMPSDVKKYKKGNGTTVAGMLRRPVPVTK
jgi:hypothetical protein